MSASLTTLPKSPWHNQPWYHTICIHASFWCLLCFSHTLSLCVCFLDYFNTKIIMTISHVNVPYYLHPRLILICLLVVGQSRWPANAWHSLSDSLLSPFCLFTLCNLHGTECPCAGLLLYTSILAILHCTIHEVENMYSAYTACTYCVHKLKLLSLLLLQSINIIIIITVRYHS